MKCPDFSLQDTGLWINRINDAPIKQFQVLGERASGTNVLRKTLQKNIEITRVETLGWKHGFPHMVAIPQNLIAVCVVRNAWDWVRSMHRRPWHLHPDQQALPFSDFIRAEWNSIVDRPADFEMLADELDAQNCSLQLDRHPLTGARFENIFALRRAKLDGLMSMANRDCNCVITQLELFNLNPKRFTKHFAEAFDLTLVPKFFKPVTERMGNAFSHSGAERHGTPAEPSPEDLEFMLKELDLDREAQLGYVYT